ncbi:MAG: Hsp20/alpha crystallin family protein [Flavobacteriaceae bacterium]|nr:Hsp20/alpha crystallin family protein [Flavobacteriaceae bacterium]
MFLSKTPLRLFPTSLDTSLFGKDWDWNFDLPVFKNSSPMVNIRETDKHYELDFAVPGMKKKDFQVELDHGVLTISTSKKTENQTREDDFIKREFAFTSFERSFELPENVNTDSINAKYQDGILRITLAKLVEVESDSKKLIAIK